MNKYKCPKCGSHKIRFWEEYIIEYEYKIRKDGKPHMKHSRITTVGSNAYGLKCEDCRNFLSLSLEGDDEWICKDEETEKENE